MSVARKLKQAVRMYLESNSEIPVHFGFDSQKVKRPHILLAVPSEEEAIIRTGTQRLSLEISLKSDGDHETSDEHHTHFEEVTDLMNNDALVQEVNNAYPADDFTLHAYQETGVSHVIEDPRTFVSTLTLSMVCSSIAIDIS